MPTTNLGRVAIVPQGAYSSAAEYRKLDIVTDAGNSYLYINDTPAAGVPLTDTSHWQQIATMGGQDLVDAAVAARDAAQGYKDDAVAAKNTAAAYAAQLAAGTASPAGTYANLAALNSGTPTAPNVAKIYITLDDGKWCYHNGSAWVAGGVYQATVDGFVDFKKSVLKHSSQLLVAGQRITGKYYQQNNIYTNDHNDYCIYPPLPLKAGVTYKLINVDSTFTSIKEDGGAWGVGGTPGSGGTTTLIITPDNDSTAYITGRVVDIPQMVIDSLNEPKEYLEGPYDWAADGDSIKISTPSGDIKFDERELEIRNWVRKEISLGTPVVGMSYNVYSGSIDKNSNSSARAYPVVMVPKGSIVSLKSVIGLFTFLYDAVNGIRAIDNTGELRFDYTFVAENDTYMYISVSDYGLSSFHVYYGYSDYPAYSPDLRIEKANVIGLGKTYRVGAGETYNSLTAAIADAILYPDSTVYVGAGTYDIVAELGASYFSGFTSGSQFTGPTLKNNIHLVFSSGAKVVCNYTGDNEWVNKLFSPLSSDIGDAAGGFTVENMELECSNVLYCIHDERAGAPDAYVNRFLNCTITLDNSANPYGGTHNCIGGGLGKHGEIIIKDNVFNSVANNAFSGIAYHNANTPGAKSHLVVTGNYFVGSNNTFRLTYLGPSTEITKAVVSNNSFGIAPLFFDEVGTGSEINAEIIQFNNTIRNP